MTNIEQVSRSHFSRHRQYMEKQTTTTASAPAALLTTEQAAAYLNVSKSTLARLRCSGRSAPRAVKIGGALRYRHSDLDAWIETQLEPAA